MLEQTFIDLITNYSDNKSYNLECWKEIKKNYTSKSRHYHNLQHLEHMLNELESVKSQVQDLDTLLFAIYYHDIFYKSTKTDNEHQSALLFEKRISKTTFPNINKCKAQIEATKEHKLSTDPDTNLLLDLDLSILGKDPKEYQTYSANIRKEYKIYPNFMYRKGRAKALNSILQQDTIFKTDTFITKYEAQARENLKTELELLEGGLFNYHN
ncbi:hypothetical protein M0G43_13840 [Subsaxibacter sp. CAU 1640]|uniref:HD domain-containing protein n=1 Tax=Subsaxibacter sp. CAU 1640 TaxID=2933271 RepID=UPI002006BC47|nr:hypothetical protein [Subsaxibacter sp. CAU 1640]MCK7591665.1 hypothetical protein [Subsaxibacter sp. CAU 1640]